MNLEADVVSVVTIVLLLELLEELVTHTPFTATVVPRQEVPQYELLIRT